MEAEEGVEAEEVEGVEPAEAADREGIQVVVAPEGADSIQAVVAGTAAVGIADTPEGDILELDNLEVDMAWAEPVPSSSWPARPLPLNT